MSRLGAVAFVITAFTISPALAQEPDDEPDPAEELADAEPAEPEKADDRDEPEEPTEEPAEEAPPTNAEAADGEAEVDAAEAEVGIDAEGDAPGEGEGAEEAPKPIPWVEFSGYFSPGFQFFYRPDGRPLDEWQYGFTGDTSLIIDAQPFEHWSGRLQLVFRPQALEFVSDVGFIERADGTGGIEDTTESVDALSIERATVTYQPIDEVGATLGVMRIPFTVQAQSANSLLMFPRRSPPNRVFVSGADVGGLLHADIEEGIVTGAAGVFNGDSLGLQLPNKIARGVVFAGRADINPFGRFPFGEGDRGGPFRVGVGGGILYRPASLFDERTGLSPVSITDLRFSGSLRVAVSGLYVSVEALRRQQTDDFSSRPEVANGAFAQASFFFRVHPTVGIEPIVRAGFVVQDDAFDPRTIGSTAAGINFYPQADDPDPDRLRLTLAYLGERRFTEGETAHGGLSRVQLTF